MLLNVLLPQQAPLLATQRRQKRTLDSAPFASASHSALFLPKIAVFPVLQLSCVHRAIVSLSLATNTVVGEEVWRTVPPPPSPSSLPTPCTSRLCTYSLHQLAFTRRSTNLTSSGVGTESPVLTTKRVSPVEHSPRHPLNYLPRVIELSGWKLHSAPGRVVPRRWFADI